jgi:hypothetical protein
VLAFAMDTLPFIALLYVYPVCLALGLLALNLLFHNRKSLQVDLSQNSVARSLIWYVQLVLCCDLVGPLTSLETFLLTE